MEEGTTTGRKESDQGWTYRRQGSAAGQSEITEATAVGECFVRWQCFRACNAGRQRDDGCVACAQAVASWQPRQSNSSMGADQISQRSRSVDRLCALQSAWRTPEGRRPERRFGTCVYTKRAGEVTPQWRIERLQNGQRG